MAAPLPDPTPYSNRRAVRSFFVVSPCAERVCMFFGSCVQPKSEGLGVTLAVLNLTRLENHQQRSLVRVDGALPGGAGVVVSISEWTHGIAFAETLREFCQKCWVGV